MAKIRVTIIIMPNIHSCFIHKYGSWKKKKQIMVNGNEGYVSIMMKDNEGYVPTWRVVLDKINI